MASKNTTNITGSTVGAVSTGDGGSAHGSVATSLPISQVGYERIIQEAQAALVRDQEKLDRIDALLYEGISDLLRMLRKVQIDQTNLVGQVAMMKSTIDDAAAEALATKLRGHGLAQGLEVAKALGMHVVTGVIAEYLLRS